MVTQLLPSPDATLTEVHAGLPSNLSGGHSTPTTALLSKLFPLRSTFFRQTSKWAGRGHKKFFEKVEGGRRNVQRLGRQKRKVQADP